MNSTSSLPGRR